MNINKLRDYIEHLATESGKILMDHFHKVKTIDNKKNAGIVTDVDTASEKFLIDSIKREFPGSSFHAEESGIEKGSSGLKWVIDPLDGTTNYACGFPWFCVSIGVEKDGDILAGAVYNPVLKEMFSAGKGEGATLNGATISVSSEGNIEDSVLATGFYYLTGSDLEPEMKRFANVQQVARGLRRAGSAALDIVHVGCGRFDAFWEKGLSPWDMAAGCLIVTEAGGIASDFKGGTFSIYDREAVFSNAHIHSSLLELLKVD